MYASPIPRHTPTWFAIALFIGCGALIFYAWFTLFRKKR
jgi:hypothetical protein